jgi:hypothetical protein
MTEDKENMAKALANLATATASDRTAFAALTNTNGDLHKQLTEAHAEIAKLTKALANKKAPNRHKHNHGFRVSEEHTSSTCNNPPPKPTCWAVALRATTDRTAAHTCTKNKQPKANPKLLL